MNLGEILCNKGINGLSPSDVICCIESNEYLNSNSGGLIIKNGKYTPLRCIGEYYCDPVTFKKVKTTSANNPCHNIKNAFGVDVSEGCANCHKQMAYRFLAGEAQLFKKKR